MSESHKLDSEKEGAESPAQQRKPYAAPQLTKWGDVEILTQGMGSVLLDNPVIGGMLITGS